MIIFIFIILVPGKHVNGGKELHGADVARARRYCGRARMKENIIIHENE
jgi:hypothetical protein